MSDTLNSLLRHADSGGSLPAPVVVNPLAAMSGAVQTAGSVYDLRQKQANEAAGETYQQAIDPQTGRFDPLKFNTLLSQNPRAAMAAKAGVESGQTLAGAQFTLNSAQNSALNAALAGVLKLPDDQLANGVVQQTQRLISAGIIPQDHAHAALLGLDGQNPAALRQQLETIWRGTLGPEQQQSVTYGTTHTQTGPSGNTIGFQVDPTTGNIKPGAGGAPQGMTPEQLNTPVWVRDTDKLLPNGQPNPGFGQFKQSTVGDQLKLLHPNTPVGAVPGQPQIPGTGRLPPGLQNPNKPPTTPPTTTEKPATRLSEADEENIKQSGPRFQADIDAGNEQNTTLATLSGMQSDINRFATGSGAAKTLDWKRAVQSWSPGIARMAGIKSDEIAAQENFQKAVSLIVTQQSRGTDKGQELQMHATPQDYLSPEGADSIIRQLQGNSDYLKARASLASKWPNRTDYGGFQSKVADLDPRYFQYNRLTPEQKAAYFNGLQDKEREEFKQSYAKTQGLIGGGG